MSEDIDKTINEFNERITVIQTLKENEGYKLLIAAFAPGEEAALNAAIDAKDLFMAAKNMAAMKVIRDLTTWADREIYVAKEHIRSLLAEKEASRSNDLR